MPEYRILHYKHRELDEEYLVFLRPDEEPANHQLRGFTLEHDGFADLWSFYLPTGVPMRKDA